MVRIALLIACLALTNANINGQVPVGPFVEHISALTTGRTGTPIRLRKDEKITTKATFKPPVEILIEAKTDSTNLRVGYAADQVIFNWEGAQHQLRVDGGPAGPSVKDGAGLVPVDKYVTIRWVVTKGKQSIYVDDELRFEHTGDYSRIDSPISIFSAHGSNVTVKSIKTRPLSGSQ